MPGIGERSPQRCPDCGLEMHWVRDAVVPNLGQQDQPGYRCANGHISDACAVCGTRNTTRFGNSPLSNRRILSFRAVFA
jgi:hypothetical protein